MSDAPPTKTVAGKWMILSVLGVGIAMAVAAWTYKYLQQHRPLQYWGASASQLILQATQVEAWRLADANQADGAEDQVDAITVGPQRLRIVDRKDVVNARGLVHFRNGMLNSRCFDWDAPAPPDAPDWTYALRFSDGANVATLLVAPTAKRVRLLETGAEVSNAPVASGYLDFFREQWPEKQD